MAIANDDDFTHALGQMPTNPEPARPFSPLSSSPPFSPPPPPPPPPTSSGLTEGASNSVALNGAATTNRGESVIAVMRDADSTASMRTAFGQWRGVTDEKAKDNLSKQAFMMELSESKVEGKVKSETVVATNAVDQSAGRDKTDESPTNGASKAGFEAKRVPNYNPLGSGPQTGAGLAEYAFEMSPSSSPGANGGGQASATGANRGGQASSPGANGGGQSPDTVVVGSTSASEISSPGSSQGNSPGQ